MSFQYVGQILMVGFNFAPSGWALCNGQLLTISQNEVLYTLIGTTYGGNGTTNFALPDLRGRVPIHPGQGIGLSNYSIGQSGGAETTTLNVNNLPSHNHGIEVSNTNGTVRYGGEPTRTLAGLPNVDMYTTLAPTRAMNPATITSTGGNQPAPNLQPYLSVNFIIALTGIFPSQG
jgi:microcystin-dependent protein